MTTSDKVIKDGTGGSSFNNKLNFKYLPGYALFLLQNHLEEYVREQVKYSIEEEIPILKLFSHLSTEELVAMGMHSSTEFLTHFIQGTTKEQIVKSAADFVKNRIPSIDREQIVALDITKISFIRKKTIRKFLHLYTDKIETANNILEEFDRYVAESEIASFNAFVEIQQEKISRMNTELELRQENLLEAQDLAKMGSFFWDMKGGQSVYTPGVMEIFELSETGNMASFYENVAEQDREKLADAIQRSFKDDGIYECEYTYIKSKHEKRIWSRGIVAFDENKVPVSMKGTIMDVTARHRILNQLKQSEELSKQAQAITHIGNWIWEIPTDKIIWSDEMYRIYGLEPQSQEITSQQFMDFTHADDRERREREINQALKTHVFGDYVMRINAGEGIKIIRGKGGVITDKNNKPVKLVGTCQDITIETKLSSDLKEKEDYLAQLIYHAPDAIIVIDEHSSIQLWNPKAEEIFGWKAEEVTGKIFAEVIIAEENRSIYTEEVKSYLKLKTALSINKNLEMVAIDKDGKEFYISSTFSFLKQGGKSNFIVFLRNINDEKQTKNALKAQASQLEKLNASLAFKNSELANINKELESFNYIASHDLQEPLRKIQTFTSRILEKSESPLPANTVDYFDKIVASASRMQALIEDLLMFSQATTNENSFEFADLNAILDEVKVILSASFEEKKAILEAGTLPVIYGVPFQLQQLLVNLISNAIKYAKENTAPHIKISSAIVEGNNIRSSAALPNKKYIELSIEDNGIGFEDENAEKIFGLFARLHNKDKYSGTGIGLAICKKIIHNHQGFIAAKSTPSVGSVFSAYFPHQSMESSSKILVN